MSLCNRPSSEVSQLAWLHLLKQKAAYRPVIVTPPLYCFCFISRPSTLLEPHADIATTRLAERIAILLFTYIIGDIYIHFWSFQIRHHQTCYTVSLSLNCHSLCKCYSAQLVKYLKQNTVRDAHIQCIHSHTYTRTHAAHTHAYYHTHTKRSTLAQHSNTATQEPLVIQSVRVIGCLKCHYFLFFRYWFAYSLTNRQVQGSGLRLW